MIACGTKTVSKGGTDLESGRAGGTDFSSIQAAVHLFFSDESKGKNLGFLTLSPIAPIIKWKK